MRRTFEVILALATAAGLGACASGGGGGATSESAGTAKAAPATQQTAAAQPAAPKMPAGYAVPPTSSKLAKVKAGMNESEVRTILGEPNNANAYMTGKGFIPFYYGPDTARTDWMYKGMGRVVFSRNQYTGQLKVIQAMYNPGEP